MTLIRPISKFTQASERMLTDAVVGSNSIANSSKNFYEKANQNPGLSITAHFAEIRDMKRYFPQNELERIEPALNKVLESNHEIKTLANEYEKTVNKHYGKSFFARRALAYYGAVRPNDRVVIDESGKSLGKLHKATTLEKFKAAVSVNFNQLKNILGF